MAVKTSEQLKAQFAAGVLPKDTDFADLIDSCMGGYDGPVIINAFIDNITYDDEVEDREYGNFYAQSYSILTTAQYNALASADAGATVIITNKKTTPFFIKVGNYDNGPDEDHSGKRYAFPDPDQEDPSYLGPHEKTFVVAPNGSILFVKVGSTYEGVPTVSAVATAVQGVVS
jgi:hypothetical protein